MQDNAKRYISTNYPEFLQYTKSDEFDVRLVCQPSNGFKMYILNMYYFKAIQLIHETSMILKYTLNKFFFVSSRMYS